jgi:hypothetical protein
MTEKNDAMRKRSSRKLQRRTCSKTTQKQQTTARDAGGGGVAAAVAAARRFHRSRGTRGMPEGIEAEAIAKMRRQAKVVEAAWRNYYYQPSRAKEVAGHDSEDAVADAAAWLGGRKC